MIVIPPKYTLYEIETRLLFILSSGQSARYDITKGLRKRLDSGHAVLELMMKRLAEEFSEPVKNIEERFGYSQDSLTLIV